MQQINAIPKDFFSVLFIREDEQNKALKTKGIFNYTEIELVTVSEKNVDTILAAQMICNVLVVLFYGNDLYSIGEVKTVGNKNLKLINGITFKFSTSRLIKECTHGQLTQYLKRFQSKNFNFTTEQQIQFVQLCCQIKYFPKIFIKSSPIPLLYSTDQNQIIKIQSPIIKLIPQLLDLQQALPINEQAGVVSTNPNVYKRIIREIIDVNKDFHSLRTVITPSVNGMMNVFNFVMYPNDGAFCSLPLIGRIIIPQSYPTNPPVFHLFTRTNRFNLDVYNGYAVSNNMQTSSICFDLVKPTSMSVSSWKPQFTVSTVFASIMSAIVSYKVQQMYGGQMEQFVTMEKLDSSFNNVKQEIIKRWKEISRLPQIPIVKATRLMCNQIKFKTLQEWQSYQFWKFQEKIISEPIYLQKQSWTAEFNLNSLSPQYVLSFVLTNNVNDLTGRQEGTILFRNGVTATAAKKLANKKINWFYHGKPLNKGDMLLNITITAKQYVFSYQDDSTEGQWIIHGDTPFTKFDEKVVGDLSKQKFYLVIYVKNKNKRLGGSFSIGQVFTNTGYIHKSCEE